MEIEYAPAKSPANLKKHGLSLDQAEEAVERRNKSIMKLSDLRTAKVRQPTHRINVDIPKGLLDRVDREAERVGVPRTSLIKIWIAERLEKTG